METREIQTSSTSLFVHHKMKSEYTNMLLGSVNKEEFGRIQMLSEEKENSHFDFSEEW